MKAVHFLDSEKKNFEVCLLCSYVQNSSQFDPSGIICTNLVEVHKDVLHTKYQNSTASSFREKEF